MTEEKRRFARVPFTIQAEMSDENHEVLLTGLVRDLSIRGLFLCTEQAAEVVGSDGRRPLQEEEEVYVKFWLVADEPEWELSLKASLMRIEDSGVGLQFKEIGIDVFTHLKNIVMYNNDGHIL